MNVFHMLEHLQQHVSRFYPAVCSHCSSLHDGADVDAAVSPVVALTNNTDSQKVVLLCQGEQTSTWQTSQQSHVQQAGKQSSTYPCWVWRWWCWGSWWSRWCCWRTTTGKAGEWNILYTHTRSIWIHAVAAAYLCRSYAIYLGHFVPASSALVSPHQVRRGALFCGAAEPETLPEGQSNDRVETETERRRRPRRGDDNGFFH